MANSDLAKLNILHVHTLPIVSGSGINTLLTMKGSRNRGHKTAIACASSGGLTEEILNQGMTVHLVPCMRRDVNPFWDLAAVFQLRRLIEQNRFDLVHTHNSKAGFVGRLAAWRAKAPTIVHTVHGFAFHDAESPLRRALFRALERIAARWCHGMIFISKPLADWADREGIGHGVPSAVIFSGIDLEAFQSADGAEFRRQWGIAPDRTVIGIIAKLWEGKGHEILLDAWQQALSLVKPSHRPLLLIVGEGPLEARLKERVASMQLGATVCFTGFLADVSAVTAAIDVSVLPSLYEGMGRVVLEAMAAGKAVIASDVGGIPGIIRHRENGLMVPPGDREALKQALVEILTNAELRNKLGQMGASGFQPEYEAGYMVEQIHRFYGCLRSNRQSRKR